MLGAVVVVARALGAVVEREELEVAVQDLTLVVEAELLELQTRVVVLVVAKCALVALEL